MSTEQMFYLLWQAFIGTDVLTETKDSSGLRTHKVLYLRSDGYWTLKWAEGMDWVAKPTLEELMLEVVRRKQ